MSQIPQPNILQLDHRMAEKSRARGYMEKSLPMDPHILHLFYLFFGICWELFPLENSQNSLLDHFGSTGRFRNLTSTQISWGHPKHHLRNILRCHEIAVKLESGWVTSYGILWGHQDFMFLSSPAFVQRARAARDRPSAHPLRWRSQLHLSKNGVPMDPQLAGEIWRCPCYVFPSFLGGHENWDPVVQVQLQIHMHVKVVQNGVEVQPALMMSKVYQATAC